MVNNLLTFPAHISWLHGLGQIMSQHFHPNRGWKQLTVNISMFIIHWWFYIRLLFLLVVKYLLVTLSSWAQFPQFLCLQTNEQLDWPTQGARLFDERCWLTKSAQLNNLFSAYYRFAHSHEPHLLVVASIPKLAVASSLQCDVPWTVGGSSEVNGLGIGIKSCSQWQPAFLILLHVLPQSIVHEDSVKIYN